MEDSATAFPDWAHLPLAAVHLISQKVKCITDYVRFRAVCSPWRSASLPKPHHLPPQLPWLMIPYMVHSGIVDDGIRLFYDLWESKMRKIPLPETIGKACCATYRGWLLIMVPGGLELFLLNPLTRARVPLPSFNIPVKHIWDGDEEHKKLLGERLPCMVDYLFKFGITHAITKITFSIDLTDPNCIIMVFFQRDQGLLYCKVGDLSWTRIPHPRCTNAELADATYNNGSFYLYYLGVMAIFNLNKHKPDMYFFEPELRSLPKFFLVGKFGVFMVVVHSTKEEYIRGKEAKVVTGKAPKQKIDLYQVIDEEPRMDVKRVADTNDTAIFYGDNYHYLAVSTDDWDSLDGNCIYMEYVCLSSIDNEVMLNPMYHTHWGGHVSCCGIFFAKLDDGNPVPVVLDVADMPPIFSPPPSMWFQPNFD